MADGEEAREVGHVRWGFYGAYVAAVGPALTVTILASLLLMQVGKATASRAHGVWLDSSWPAQYLQFFSLSYMQASRNGSDLWLSYWVSHAMPQELRQSGNATSDWLDENHTLAAEGSTVMPQKPILQTADWWRETLTANIMATAAGRLPQLGLRFDGQSNHPVYLEGPVPEGVAFFLSVLLMFAACNSLFTLVR